MLWLVLLVVGSVWAEKRPLSPELVAPVQQVYAGLQRSRAALTPVVAEVEQSLLPRPGKNQQRLRMRARRTRSRLQKVMMLQRAVDARLNPLAPSTASDAELLKCLHSADSSLDNSMQTARQILTLQMQDAARNRKRCERMNQELRAQWKRFDAANRQCLAWPVRPAAKN